MNICHILAIHPTGNKNYGQETGVPGKVNFVIVVCVHLCHGPGKCGFHQEESEVDLRYVT